MNDEQVIKLLCTPTGKIVGARLNDKWLNKHFGLKEYIYNRFDDVDNNTSLVELIYRIRNKLLYIVS